MKPHRVYYQMVLVILLVIIVILAGTVWNFDKYTFPRMTMPDTLNGAWAQQFEQYLQEHLGFHDELFHLKSSADLLIGEKMIQGVYVTDERLLEKLSTEYVPESADSAEPVNQFYEKTGLPSYLILVPSASSIYRSVLPANAVNAEQKERIQQIYLETVSGVQCIDAYNTLASLKENYIYYRTDTRWTCYGAYCVYQSAIQKMGFTPVAYQKYVISHLSTEFKGDLYARTLYDGVKSDVLDCYSNETGGQIISVTAYYADGREENRGNRLYDSSALASEDMYQYYLGTPCQKLVIQTNVENDKKLLLYKDSFADCAVPFLLQHYSEVCIVDLTQTKDYLTAADPSAYTQALFLCSLRSWEQFW